MYKFAAPVFILFITALAYAQVEQGVAEQPAAAENTQATAPSETPPTTPPSEAPPATPPADAPTAPSKTGQAPSEAQPAAPSEAAPATPSKTEQAPADAKPAAPAPSAEEPTPEAPPPNPLAEVDVVEILFIASNGMSERIDLVREAIKKAVPHLKEGSHLSLRVSGHRIAADDAVRSCQDSELLIVPSADGSKAISASLKNLQAQGRHAIAQSLSHALADLDAYGGTKSIVLITDGIEDCIQQSPADYLVASSLADKGYRIHVRTIGLDETAAGQLQELAIATGGSFSAASDGFTLVQQLAIALQGTASVATADTAETPPPTDSAPTSPDGTPTEGTAASDTAATAPEDQAGTDSVATPPPPHRPSPPFDPQKFTQGLLKEIGKLIQAIQPPQAAPPPPPQTFSMVSLIIISVETLLLFLALAGLAFLGLKEYRRKE